MDKEILKMPSELEQAKEQIIQLQLENHNLRQTMIDEFNRYHHWQIENEKLQAENERLKDDLKSQQMINLKQQENALDYWNALEEIKNNFMCFRSCMIPFHVGNKENLPHNMADAIQNYCESIMNKINEVIGAEE